MYNNFKYPYARFLNASPDAGTVNFFINDKETLSGFPFGQISGYKQIPDGSVTFRAVWNNGGDNIIYTINADIKAGDVFTLALAGDSGAGTLLRINDITEKNAYNASNFRIANLVSDFDGFDIYANGFPILDDIEFTDISDYIFLRPDTYEFSVRAEGTDDLILNTGNQILKPQKFYTLYIIGNVRNDGVPVKAVFATDAMSYNGQYL